MLASRNCTAFGPDASYLTHRQVVYNTHLKCARTHGHRCSYKKNRNWDMRLRASAHMESQIHTSVITQPNIHAQRHTSSHDKQRPLRLHRNKHEHKSQMRTQQQTQHPQPPTATAATTVMIITIPATTTFVNIKYRSNSIVDNNKTLLAR